MALNGTGKRGQGARDAAQKMQKLTIRVRRPASSQTFKNNSMGELHWHGKESVVQFVSNGKQVSSNELISSVVGNSPC